MIDILPVAKELAQYGITPIAAIGLGILFKISKVFSLHDKRIALLEQKTTSCEKC